MPMDQQLSLSDFSADDVEYEHLSLTSLRDRVILSSRGRKLLVAWLLRSLGLILGTLGTLGVLIKHRMLH